MHKREKIPGKQIRLKIIKLKNPWRKLKMHLSRICRLLSVFSQNLHCHCSSFFMMEIFCYSRQRIFFFFKQMRVIPRNVKNTTSIINIYMKIIYIYAEHVYIFVIITPFFNYLAFFHDSTLVRGWMLGVLDQLSVFNYLVNG